ncbi:hypothetical protein EG68_04860 [Paragonimus skrjabini miyazakii]|uniref:PDZ domain-containing protein n=1 Tax=Paragonimus skrjabini miyazakii TaxID=59628 RepID=A0A8S9YTX6_9TREM|nr:hypothetical protein EG68_04860 [Paragonimus skrjabini miyazakii]
MVGLNLFPCFSPDKVGFYQRLLQIRNISDAHVTTMYAVQPHITSSTSVRPGDILLAVGGHRLAGCSPEYAVRILAAVPLGGIVPVTLLRGLPLAPVNITQDQQDLPVKFGDCVLQPVKQVVVPQAVLPQNSCSNCDQYAGQTKCYGQNGQTMKISISLVKQNDGFGFSLLKSSGKYFVIKTSTAHANGCFADKLNNGLEPGDELIEINQVNVDSYKDHHSIMQELKLVPVGQLVQFTVVRARRSPSQLYKKSAGMLADLPDATANRMPFNCSLQGVGISGPCKTPDYVPASHFINKSMMTLPPNATTASLNQSSADVTKLARIRDFNEYPTSNLVISTHLGRPVDQPQISNAQSYIDIQVAVPKELAAEGIQFVTCPQIPGFLQIESVRYQKNGEQISTICAGDLLLSIGDKAVINSTPEDIQRILRFHSELAATDSVCMTVRRMQKQELHPITSKVPVKIRFRSFQSQETGEEEAASKQPISLRNCFNLELQRHEDEGFGFVLVSSLNCDKASEIGRIIPGSPADRCGKLRVGHRIVAINGQTLAGMHHTDIVQLIRRSQKHLLLTIETDPSNDAPSLTNSNVNTDYPNSKQPYELKQLQDLNEDDAGINPTIDTSWSEKPPHNVTCNTHRAGSLLCSIGQPAPSIYAVTLRRGAHGFGFSLRGGTDYDRVPLFVFRIADGGPTYLDGRIQIGDEILEINGVPAHAMTHQQAVDTINKSGSELHLLLSDHSCRLLEASV